MEKIIFKTGVCANCGADLGLHRSGDDACPKNGMEISMSAWNRGERQQWSASSFEDSGYKRLHDAAPLLYEACEWAIGVVTDKAVYEKLKQALSAAK